jgi:hypothetical protein
MCALRPVARLALTPVRVAVEEGPDIPVRVEVEHGG